MTATTADILVIGGGVVGCAIAYELARRGARPMVVERWEIAAAASGASAGGVRQQGRDHRELPLAIAAIARWQHLEAELAADLHYHRQGHLKVIEDEADLPLLEAEALAQRALGLDIQVVAGAELRALAPGLAPHVIAGTYTANDGHADPGQTTRAFAAAALRQGAVVRPGTRVLGLTRAGSRLTGARTDQGTLAADWVVLAAGAWSRQVLQTIGIDLPIRPAGLQMMRTTPRPPGLRQVIGARTRRLSLKQLRGGQYLIGGGWPGDINLDQSRGVTRPASLTGSRQAAAAIFPDLAHTEIEAAWVGIEAFTPDEVPILGPIAGIENLTVAAGFSGHGFALGPMTGRVLAELIMDGCPSLPLDAFAAARFAGAAANRWSPTPDAG